MVEETPRKLMDATETLLVEKGHASVTLRDITQLAGANVAAVAYHFGSKDELVARVFRDALSEVTEAQQRAIEALPKEASLRDVISTWLSPALNPEGTPARQRKLWAVIHRGALEQAPGLVDAASSLVNDRDNALFSRLSVLLPNVPRPLLQLRHDLVLGGVSALFGRGLQGPSDLPLPSPMNAAAIVDWVVGGMSADVTQA